MPESTQYSAKGSLLGYIYQCRLALLEALTRLRRGDSFCLSLETLDDVAFDPNGSAKELLQVKHHVNEQASLTDKSVDLWKSIGIWIDLRKEAITPENSIRCLLTTAQADSNCATSYLRTSDQRDCTKALTLITSAARSITNKSIIKDCKAFLALTEEERAHLLESIYVFDSQPSVSNLEQHLQWAIRFNCTSEQEVTFLNYLEGWWWNRSIHSLTESDKETILSNELTSQLDDLRDSFKTHNLPISDELITAEKDIENYADFRFVRQLELINITNSRRIAIAVNNYYRAFTQRSRWLREDLLIQGDLDNYDRQLHEEWEVRFEEMRERIDEETVDQEKAQLARDLYKWAEQDADIPIRRDCTHSFIVRGSYHMLADREQEPTVGWHPEFKERLKRCLEPIEQEANK